MKKYNLIEAISETLYSIGGINRDDLETLLSNYSKDPNRYIKKLIADKVCEYNQKTRIVTLSKTKQRSLKAVLQKTSNKNIINSHTLICARVLIWYLINQRPLSYELEKSVNNTSLKVDLYIKHNDELSTYIESDTGTEREQELRNKIINYVNLDREKNNIIFITISENNYRTIKKLIEGKSNFGVYLNNDLENYLGSFNNQLDNKNINLNTKSNIEYKMSYKDIEKYITDI